MDVGPQREVDDAEGKYTNDTSTAGFATVVISDNFSVNHMHALVDSPLNNKTDKRLSVLLYNHFPSEDLASIIPAQVSLFLVTEMYSLICYIALLFSIFSLFKGQTMQRFQKARFYPLTQSHYPQRTGKYLEKKCNL